MPSTTDSRHSCLWTTLEKFSLWLFVIFKDVFFFAMWFLLCFQLILLLNAMFKSSVPGEPGHPGEVSDNGEIKMESFISTTSTSTLKSGPGQQIPDPGKWNQYDAQICFVFFVSIGLIALLQNCIDQIVQKKYLKKYIKVSPKCLSTFPLCIYSVLLCTAVFQLFLQFQLESCEYHTNPHLNLDKSISDRLRDWRDYSHLFILSLSYIIYVVIRKVKRDSNFESKYFKGEIVPGCCLQFLALLLLYIILELLLTAFCAIPLVVLGKLSWIFSNWAGYTVFILMIFCGFFCGFCGFLIEKQSLFPSLTHYPQHHMIHLYARTFILIFLLLPSISVWFFTLIRSRPIAQCRMSSSQELSNLPGNDCPLICFSINVALCILLVFKGRLLNSTARGRIRHGFDVLRRTRDGTIVLQKWKPSDSDQNQNETVETSSTSSGKTSETSDEEIKPKNRTKVRTNFDRNRNQNREEGRGDFENSMKIYDPMDSVNKHKNKREVEAEDSACKSIIIQVQSRVGNDEEIAGKLKKIKTKKVKVRPTSKVKVINVSSLTPSEIKQKQLKILQKSQKSQEHGTITSLNTSSNSSDFGQKVSSAKRADTRVKISK